jgi:hypothetical protein
MIEHRKVDWAWLEMIEYKDLLTSDMALIHDHCGLAVMCSVSTQLSSLHLYISEKPIFEAKKRFIRQYHNPRDEKFNTKAIAVLLGVSTKFVDEALADVAEKDERQEKLL